jgi:hypothetical protein
MVSVDCVDFPIPHAGRKFYTHKWRFHSALRYEIAVCILSGDCVWVNGPYEAGMWNDIKIFRNALLSELEDGERVESDDGLRGLAPKYAKCPSSMGNKVELEAMQSLIRSRHETINKRFKQWNILKQIFKGEITHHGEYVSMVAVITQVAIEHGEPLFQVNYQDPYYDDCYFDESDDEDEEDYE